MAGLISTAHCVGASGMNADKNIARGIIETIGVGKIVRRYCDLKSDHDCEYD